MPRILSDEREAEFQELSAYIEFFATHIWKVEHTNPTHPSSALKHIVERYGKFKALEGLRQAVNDTVTYGSDKPLSFVQELDMALRKNNLITFSEVRRRYSAAFKRILRRGGIRNEAEYYLIAGIVADCTAELEPDQHLRLEEFITTYKRVI